MIRIVSAPPRHAALILHCAPPLELRPATDLGFARYERIAAGEPISAFEPSVVQVVIALTKCTEAADAEASTLSLLRPGDRAEGVRLGREHCELLIFTPGFIEKFLNEGLNGAALRPILRTKPDRITLWLWSWLAAAAEPTCDIARARLETTANMLIAVLVPVNDPNVTHVASYCRPAVELVRQRIRDDLAGQLTVPELAAAAGLSPFHLCRVFRRETGQSVHQYIVEQRLMRVCALLESSRLPLSQIALEAGFASQSHMNAQFKRRFRTTPRAWRTASRTCAFQP